MSSQSLTTSLSAVAGPASSPTQTVARPSAAKAGRTRSRTDWGPLARTRSWPDSAGSRLPDTGASTNATPAALANAANSWIPVRPTVPICTHTDPAEKLPIALVMTEVVAAASGSMVITTEAPLTASSALAATCAPLARSGSARPGVRFQTVTSRPAASRERAIAEPMMPVPSTATRPWPVTKPV